MKRVICLSHSKDVDGLCSAAIVKMVQGGETVLSDYNDLIEKLAEIDDVEKLYVCDLGLNHKNQDDFLRHMSRLSKKGEVEYIDHHPLAEEFKEKIESAGVKLTHSTEESCSILVFKRFQHEVSKITSMIAAFGAIGDFMDFRPIASEIIEGFDRLFLLFETTVLSHAIAKKNKDRDTLVEFVTRLSEGELPHMMNKVIEYAAQHASTVSEIMIQVQKNGKTMKNLSFIRTDQGPLGSVASLLLGAFGLSVGIALKSEEGFTEISGRATSRFQKHLGKMMADLSSQLGGYGGGHARASGARIPSTNSEKFLFLLDEGLEETNE